MGIIMKDGRQYGVGGITPAENVTYDNTESGMTATDVQGALDELKGGLTYKFYMNITDTSEKTLPAEFNELTLVGKQGNQRVLTHVPKLMLDNNTQVIFMGVPASIVASIILQTSTIKVNSFLFNGSSSSVNIDVYYR